MRNVDTFDEYIYKNVSSVPLSLKQLKGDNTLNKNSLPDSLKKNHVYMFVFKLCPDPDNDINCL